MKDTIPTLPEIYTIWMRIRNKTNLMESIPRDFGIGEPLYLTEIHTLQAIGKTPDNNVRIIAGLMGVTPSAASQVITRLTRRGLVRKIRGVRNEKEVALELTEKGRVAYTTHEKIHGEMYDLIAEQISHDPGVLSDHDRLMLFRVFCAFESAYDARILELTRNPDRYTSCRKRSA
jgi:DNA-binding MarR family transcriptional regulator